MLFVAVATSGTGNRVMTSPDGVTWTARTSAADNSWNSICWAAELGLFVVVGSTGTGNRVMTSPDGITWTTRTSAADNSWLSVCWAAELGLLVACAIDGTDRIMTSADGITWTARATGGAGDLRAVAWSPELSRLVATSRAGGGRYSDDGITWTAFALNQTSVDCVTWAADMGLFIGVKNTAGTVARYVTSADGSTWVTLAATSNRSARCVIWIPALFRAVSMGENGPVTSRLVAWHKNQRYHGAMSAAPSDSVSIVGDTYFDTDDSKIYQKTGAASWTALN